MVSNDVILAKVAVIQRCLQRIKDVTDLNPERLSDFNTQDIFVLNLQRAIQAVAALASHVISNEGWGVPDTLRQNFYILAEKGVIDDNLRDKLLIMIGFRNVAVHDYPAIDLKILQSILKSNLIDIENFYNVILNHYKITN